MEGVGGVGGRLRGGFGGRSFLERVRGMRVWWGGGRDGGKVWCEFGEVWGYIEGVVVLCYVFLG